jgi:hypothetical protein
MKIVKLTELLKSESRIGFINSGPGIGDNVYYSFVPEAVFNNTGKKLIDIEKKWVYDYNPFVDRDKLYDVIIDIFSLSASIPKDDYLSTTERFCKILGFKITNRHPNLYRFENSDKINKSICIHTNGKSTNDIIPSNIIEYIDKKYPKYDIFQIGGKGDIDTPFINKKGLSLWDTAELISKCEIFLGINSSMMHIANCFPSIWKKIILMRSDLDIFYPCSGLIGSEWFDYSNVYFNTSEQDIGITYTYRKI